MLFCAGAAAARLVGSSSWSRIVFCVAPRLLGRAGLQICSCSRRARVRDALHRVRTVRRRARRSSQAREKIFPIAHSVLDVKQTSGLRWLVSLFRLPSRGCAMRCVGCAECASGCVATRMLASHPSRSRIAFYVAYRLQGRAGLQICSCSRRAPSTRYSKRVRHGRHRVHGIPISRWLAVPARRMSLLDMPDRG